MTEQKQQQSDPRSAEIQLYTRMEQARTRIYSMVNQLIQDTGLPAVLVANMVREVATETMLQFEREAHRQTREELARRVKEEKGG